MKKGFLYWLPRILGILFTLFISIFALDAFGEGTPFLEAVVGFLIHLVPTYFTIIILLIAWKWEIAGGILYILLSGFYLLVMNDIDLISFLLIGGPPILIGILFIISHFKLKISPQ